MELSRNSDWDLKVDPVSYLLASPEPWVKYNTLVHLLDRGRDELEVVQSKRDLLSNQRVIELIEECQEWPGTALIRHNDAKHIIHMIGLLADFGLKTQDLGITLFQVQAIFHSS